MSRSLPIYVAAQSTGYGTGWWLSEWLWQPGSDATDVIVFQAFAANFLVLASLAVIGAFREQA
ncbi:hypothetical protein [Streptosporangium sp. CA-115845]|uniref:hypothetical protein n=1 Tax=Streptosporangium sp. CA-115845 TaxID=3240071 RepID=UPI003D8BDF58